MAFAQHSPVRWLDSLWGYDVFIAHRRVDAAPYALAIHAELKAAGISCFIDQAVYAPGESLVVATRRHVTKSTLLLLLGSPELPKLRRPVDWIQQELDTYLATHSRDPRVILVDFGNVITDALSAPAGDANPILVKVQPFIRISQSAAALHHAPAEAVIDAIRRNLQGRRRDRSRLRFFEALAVILAALLVLAVALGLARERQRRLAESQRLVAESRLSLDSPPGTQTAILQALAALVMADTADSRSIATEIVRAVPTPAVVIDSDVRDGGIVFGAWMDDDRIVAESLLAGVLAIAISNGASSATPVAVSTKCADRRYSMNGHRMACARDANLEVWDLLTTRKVFDTPLTHFTAERAVALNANGSKLAIADRTSVVVIDVENGASVRGRLPGSGWPPLAMAVSPDGARVAMSPSSFGVNERVPTYLLDLHHRTSRIVTQQLSSTAALEFFAAGDRLAIGTHTGALNIIDVRSGSVALQLSTLPALTGLAVSHDGRFLAAAAFGAASVVDLLTGSEVAKASTDGPIYSVSFDSRGTRLLTAGARSDSLGRLVVWNLLDSARFASAFVVPDSGILTAGFAADGRLLMTTFAGRRVANLRTGTTDDSEQTKYWNVNEILTADETQQALFIGQEIGSATAVVRNLAGAAVGPTFDASAVAAAPDGSLLASLLFRGDQTPSRLQIWRAVGSTPSVDVEHSAALVGLNAVGGDVVLAFSATRTTPSRIGVYAVSDLRRVAVVDGGGQRLVATVNPRERVVAVGDRDTLTLRRLPDLVVIVRKQFAGTIQELVFSPSGRTLGVIDSSGTISILNNEGGVQLIQRGFFEGSQRRDAAFSPTDESLAVVAQVSGKSSLLLIPARVGALADALCQRLTDEPTTAAWRTLVPNDSLAASCPTSAIRARREPLTLMPPLSLSSTELWIDTGMRLEKGKLYELVASGVWTDASIVTDPNGYDSVNFFQRITERLRRMPEARWFALIGAVDRRRETQFTIGTGTRYTATDTGQLTCFANDLRGFYFNNSGTITLTVKESR